MTIHGLYDPQNIGRVRHAQIVAAVLAVAVSTYMAGTTVLSMQQVWSARRLLSEAKTEAAELSRQAAIEQRREMRQPKLDRGGIDSFVVSFSAWARSRNIRVESCTPEGTPAPTEITSGTVKLGVWNASKVRVKGRGGFREVMSLLEEFETSLAPVRLESYALQASQDDDAADVTFDLLVTVYEKADQTGQANASS